MESVNLLKLCYIHLEIFLERVSIAFIRFSEGHGPQNR